MRSLDAICETFAPGAVEQGVPDAVLDAIDHDLTARERQRLLLLLRTWLPGYARLPHARRETVLRLWRDSPVPVLRTGFQALRKAALAFAYLLPGRWEEIGYPGPLGAHADAPAARLEPIEAADGLELECDVCVVGSGAGGGVAAAVLAAAGLDVVVLEAGGYWSERDFDGAERAGLRRLYRGGGAAATDDQGVALIAGACLGGGTVVNYTTSFRTPDDVLAEWEGLGFPSASSGRASTRSVPGSASTPTTTGPRGATRRWRAGSSRSAGTSTRCRATSSVASRASSAARAATAARSERSSRRCAPGSRTPRAQERGSWSVRRRGAYWSTNGAAAGVDAGPVQVRCRAVVAAAGAIETPALLLRSGLTNPNVGRGLRLHPATAVFGIFEEEIRPWEGTLQALYSDQFRFLDGGYGVKLETVPLHPALLAAALPWEGAAAHAAADGEPAAALADRRDSARCRRRSSSDRARRRGDRDVPAGRRRCAPPDGGDRGRRPHHGRRRRTRDLHRQRSDAALVGRLPGGRVPVRPRPRLAVLVPPDGLGPHGRLAGQVSGSRRRARRGTCATS